MKNPATGAAKRLLFSLFVVASLSGCAVYDPGYGAYGGYGGYGGYSGYSGYSSPSYYGAPVYPAAPVYGYGVAPFYAAPSYVPNPVLQFNYRSGGGHRHHDGGSHGWRGGERRAHEWGNRGQNHGPRSEGRGRGHWRDGGHAAH